MIIDISFIRSQACRELILTAATELLNDRAGSVSLEDIARRAELPRAAVSWHFPSLQMICDEVLKNFFHEHFPLEINAKYRRLAASKQHVDGVFFLQAFMDTIQKMIKLHAGLFKQDLFQVSDNGQRVKASYFSELLESFVPHFHEIIEDGKQDGIFIDGIDTEQAVEMLIRLIQGGAMDYLFLETENDLSYYFDKIQQQAKNLLCGKNYDWDIWTE